MTLVFNTATGDTQTADGTPVTEDTAGTLLVDVRFRALRLDEHGNPLDLGRAQRLFTAQQRTALTVRDGGCVFGCDRPVQWCDAHHVTHWDDDGLTNLDNGALLCRHHHGVTHRNGWRMTADIDQQERPTGWFTWTTPTGRIIHSQRYGRQKQQWQQEHWKDRRPRAA